MNDLTPSEIINIISSYSLTVRCLPHVVVSHWTYRDGDENKKYVDSKGNPIERDLEVVKQDFDLEYFQKTPPPKYSNSTPEQRLEQWKKLHPNGRKLLKETKKVEKGGWWYVKSTPNTDSIVQFSRKHDEFFAPTLEGAIQLFLNSL